ncbi:Thiol-disulfide isomerase/thioredoxin [Rubrivivax sp. A210]|uniref:TlpA family protein disulfide reductase n=1 Tax=Rubrivivax sp. A210 TaxID=2772301 RepID=UPI00191A277C|nr:TlpA disulfide reductase family protein [Rubrivivax sp. A210]CAD5375265.1 Thiol-disulfide isomerase/thioredoxin [Rubrivivax sp. A210]
MNRRLWIFGGAGAAAALAGLAWRQAGEQPAAATAPAAAASAPGAKPGPRGEPAPDSLWQTRLPQPGGGELVMQSLRGQLLLINFWATWCVPCVKEMPELDQFQREHAARGWHVVGLALDNAKAVREFLARAPVSYAIGLAGFEGTDLARQLGNDKGGLPFTVVVNRQGEIVKRRLGQTHLAELTAWAAEF